MISDREGLDRLKQVLAEVAASLPPSRPRSSAPRGLLWAASLGVVVVAAALGGSFLLRRPARPASPVEVLALRIDGLEARVEVLESAGVGIVIIARPGEDAEAGEGGVRR